MSSTNYYGGGNIDRMLNKVDTIEFCDKLNEFRTRQKYHDLTILVEGETFACHKIILASSSTYFDSMLGGDFQESKTDKITLDTLSAETFGQILSFMYSREIKINSENVTNLLMASHFFGMSLVEKLCLEYVERHYRTLPCENVLEVLQFAVNINKCHHTVMQNLCVNLTGRSSISTWSRCNLFTEICFTVLNMILQWIDYARDGDEIVEAVLRWINYKLDDRIEMLPEIIEMIEFGTTDAHYLKRLLEFANDYKKTAVASSSKLICCDDRNYENILSSLQVSFLNNNPIPSYLGTLALDYKKLEWKCYSKRNCMTFMDGNNKTNSISVSSDFYIARTVIGDNLYHIFASYCKSPTFVYSSTRNIFKQIRLKDPPIKNVDVDLQICSGQDKVYLNYCRPDVPSIEDDHSYRGIYVYQSEPNEWSSLPECPMLKSRKTLLVPCNNVLYLFAGVRSLKQYPVCRYDSRTFKWQELPSAPSILTRNENLAVCAFNEKFYITYGGSATVMAFDPVANKWDLKSPKMKTYNEFSMVTYNNLIWAIGKTLEDEIYGVEVYNPKTNLWSNFKSPDAAMGLKKTDRHRYFKMFDAINIHSSK